jgi:hypothetical protein
MCSIIVLLFVNWDAINAQFKTLTKRRARGHRARRSAIDATIHIRIAPGKAMVVGCLDGNLLH